LASLYQRHSHMAWGCGENASKRLSGFSGMKLQKDVLNR